MKRLGGSLRGLALGAVALAGLLRGSPAHAQIPLQGLEAFFERDGGRLLRRGSVMVHGEASQLTKAMGSSPAGPWALVAAGSGTRAERSVLRFSTRRPPAWGRLGGVRLRWSPPRHLLVDRATEAAGLPRARARGAGSGAGVVIGIVDTGLDVAHPAFLDAEGRSRIAYYLDFSADPQGRQPALEQALGCLPEPGLRCAVLAGSDLDERLSGGAAEPVPRDLLGHGTHVASIAAGADAGLGPYAGVAPEATLVVAAVAGPGGSVTDGDVVLATQFVFDRAAELGAPAVVNLSLGGDFGPHDGSSDLAQALAAMVPEEQAGRALVVAAGNSGTLFAGVTQPELEPLGVHRELRVDGEERIPLLATSHAGASTLAGSLLVWLNLYPDSELRVGLAGPGDLTIEPQLPGAAQTAGEGDVAAAVITGREAPPTGSPGSNLSRALPASALPESGAAVVLVDGSWPAVERFEVVVRGRGRVEMWLQAEGAVGAGALPFAALLPSATAAQTITIPAVHPDLIAVGATTNRTDWIDDSGRRIDLGELPDTFSLLPGSTAEFSSGGPNATGHVKPDVVAPGAYVVGALSAAADPRSNPFSVFHAEGECAPSNACLVVQERYAIGKGTSMAAPVVTGAVALLLEKQPGLTQRELRDLLRAGARPPEEPSDSARAGGGHLDVAGAFESLAGASSAPVSAERSRWVFGREFAVPDRLRSVHGAVVLRDEQGDVAGVDFRRLRLTAVGGVISEPLSSTAAGLLAFAVAPERTGVEGRIDIRLELDGRTLMSHRLPVLHQAAAPRRDSSGWCSHSTAPGRSGSLGSALMAALWLWRRRRRARVGGAGARSTRSHPWRGRTRA